MSETGSFDGNDRRSDSRYVLPAVTGAQSSATITLQPFDTVHAVKDLSQRGMCFESALRADELPDQVDAILTLDRTDFSVVLRVVNDRDGRLGCQIVRASGDWNEHVAKFLDPVRLGQRLREIDPRFVVQPQGKMRLRQYEGGPGCDVYVWETSSGMCAKAQVFYKWTLVEWTEEHGLRSGRAKQPPHSQRATVLPMAAQFQLTAPPDPSVLAPIQRLIEASKLPGEIRSLFFGPQ